MFKTKLSLTKFYPGFSLQMIVDFCNENDFKLIYIERDDVGYVSVVFEHRDGIDSPYITYGKVEIDQGVEKFSD